MFTEEETRKANEFMSRSWSLVIREMQMKTAMKQFIPSKLANIRKFKQGEGIYPNALLVKMQTGVAALESSLA